MAITPGSQFSVSVPTTAILSAEVVQQTDIDSQEFKELLVQLGDYLNYMAQVINRKDTGYYPLQEYACNKSLFPNPAFLSSSANSQQDRPVFRTTLNFGSLPNAGTKSIPHNITINAAFLMTYIQAVASDTTGFSFIPIPFCDTAAPANNIMITVDAVNVNITTGVNRTNYNQCIVYLEYVQT